MICRVAATYRGEFTFPASPRRSSPGVLIEFDPGAQPFPQWTSPVRLLGGCGPNRLFARLKTFHRQFQIPHLTSERRISRMNRKRERINQTTKNDYGYICRLESS